MMILGRNEDGTVVTISDEDDIDAVDLRWDRDRMEYVYLFRLFGDEDPVAVPDRALTHAGRAMANMFAL